MKYKLARPKVCTDSGSVGYLSLKTSPAEVPVKLAYPYRRNRGTVPDGRSYITHGAATEVAGRTRIGATAIKFRPPRARSRTKGWLLRPWRRSPPPESEAAVAPIVGGSSLDAAPIVQPPATRGLCRLLGFSRLSAEQRRADIC